MGAPVDNATRLKEYKRQWWAANRERCNEKARARYQAKKDEYKRSAKQWVERNKEKRQEIARRYNEAHKQEALMRLNNWAISNPDRRASAIRKWREENKHKLAAKEQRRRATKLLASPVWANHFFIEEIYHLAFLRSKATGYKWHVDHIVPLKSKMVCGLHVESNLRVVPATVNLKKHNSYWPDMPEQVRRVAP